MASVDATTVEKYQQLFEKDPTSRVFAPLAEAYRQMGMMKEAEDLCRAGIKRHPNFAGGRIALAKLLLDQNEHEAAKMELEMAIRLAPENALALNLLADTHLYLRQPKSALKVFKTLLFLAPENEKAQMAVRKLESLTAAEYEEEIFKMRPISEAVKDWDNVEVEASSEDAKAAMKQRTLERIISLADAYMVRNDQDQALEALTEGERMFGSDPEIVRRLKILHQRGLDQITVPKTAVELRAPESRVEAQKRETVQELRGLLRKFQGLRRD